MNGIHHGDNLDVMPTMAADSIDAIVTDPPYGLEFMGKGWDRGVPGTPFWEAMLRVAKPGAYLLAFGGTRTVHRQTCAIEDAGWLIRDVLCWVYSSGFPKSKASLKPAWEPIVLARKPGPLQPLGIDAARIGVEPRFNTPAGNTGSEPVPIMASRADYEGKDVVGRWPANVVLTDPAFDGEGWEDVVGGGKAPDSPAPKPRNHKARPREIQTAKGAEFARTGIHQGYSDSGTYSRFFLVPKAARTDREPVLKGALATAELRTMGNGVGTHAPGAIMRENVHPTVKPIDLMRHLVRLVTPLGGTVLDPFAGSGTTLLAADQEGFGWVGIEREAEYAAIIEARLDHNQMGLGL